MKLINPTFRRPHGSVGQLGKALMHAEECQDYALTSPLIYLPDPENQNSFCLQLRSVQGPHAGENAVILARRALTILRDAGISASARIPGVSEMLQPIVNGDTRA